MGISIYFTIIFSANNNSRLVIAFIGLLANTALAVEYFIPWTKEVPVCLCY